MAIALMVRPTDWIYKIYVIGPDNGPYKIGLARDLYSRFHGIQVGSHEDLSIHWYFNLLRHEEAKAIEKLAHKALEANRIRGEWFRVKCEQAIDAIWRALDKRVYVARQLSTKDLRGHVPLQTIYEMAVRAQESIVNGENKGIIRDQG